MSAPSYAWDFSFLWGYRWLILFGLAVTIAYTIGTILLGLVIGLVTGLLRLSRNKLLTAPLVAIFIRAVEDKSGTFVGLANFAAYVGNPSLIGSVWNSLFVSALTTVIVIPLAFVYAYALTRTPMRLGGVFRLVAMLPIFAPSLVQGIAFVYVFGNNGIVTRLTGMNVGIYGFKGIVAAETKLATGSATTALVSALWLCTTGRRTSAR